VFNKVINNKLDHVIKVHRWLETGRRYFYRNCGVYQPILYWV